MSAPSDTLPSRVYSRMSCSRTASIGAAPASSMPTIVPGKKIRPVVLVESISGIIPERRLRRMIGRIACALVAPSARRASIAPAESVTSSPSLLSATAAAVIALPITIPPTGTR